MKKWYWKNGMAFLLAVAMLFTDIVPALADNDMGETEIPTYDTALGVSSSDILLEGPTGITWLTTPTASGSDVVVYKATGQLQPDNDGKYSIMFSWGIPTTVSTNDLQNGTVSTSDLEEVQTVAQYFNTETPKAGETTKPITLTIDKNTSYKIIVDWDGSKTPDDNSYDYRETTYILDFSGIDYAPKSTTPAADATPEPTVEPTPTPTPEPTVEPTATPTVTSGDVTPGDAEEEKPEHPDGQIETVAFGEIPEVTAFKLSDTTLNYVSEIPLTYLDASKYGVTDISKGYAFVAVKVTAPETKSVKENIDKTTVDGVAWDKVENVDGTSFIKVIKVPAADKDGKIANQEIKVDWAGKGSVTYTLDFANAKIGSDADYPDTVFAAPAKLAIVSGYSKKLAVGAVQQLDVKITKSLPTDTVSVRFFSDSTNVNKDLLPYGIVQPTDTGKIKIYAQAVDRAGKEIGPKSKAITITATKVAGPKSVKVDKKALSDVSAKITWKADDVYAGIDNVTVEYEAVAAATVKATEKDSIVLTDKQLGVAAGKSVKVSVNKIVKVDGKVVGTGTTKVKVTLAKVLPASIKFESASVKGDLDDKKAPTNKLTIVYPDKSEVVYPKTKKGAAKLSVAFKSSNENVAKVDKKGKITMKGMGSAVITATVTIPGGKDLIAFYNVNVTATIAKVSAKKKSLTMTIGDTKNVRDLLVYKTAKGKTISSASVPSEIVAADIEKTFGAYFKVTTVSGSNAGVSGSDVTTGDVTGGNVSANDILLTAVETTGKKGESFKITDKVATKTDTATVKIIVKALKAPGKVKAVKGGAAGDSVTVTFNKSANANYYLAQLKVGKRKAGAPVVIPNSGSAKTITYTFKNLSPKTKYSVELTACYIAPKKVQTSKVVKATINTKKLAIKALEDITKYDVSVGDLVSLKTTVSGSDVTPGDVTGGNAAAKDEWTVEVPCGEQVVISTVVDAYVRATGSDTLTWNISKADKKFVTVTKSKNTFDATLTGKKSSPIGKTATVIIKSKATGKVVGTLKVKVVPNASYAKKK